MKVEYLDGTNIVSLSPVRGAMTFAAVSQIEAYWEGLRGTRLMPRRAEVNPRGISDILEYAFILEKIAPGMARIRLAGMHLNDLMGMEVRGMPLTALFLPEARRQVQDLLHQVLDGPATARIELGSDRGLSRPRLDAQMYMAPLTDDHGQVTRVLGVLQSQGALGRAPRRFSVRNHQLKPLLRDEALPEGSPDEKRGIEETRGLSEDMAAFEHQLRIADELRSRAGKRQAEKRRNRRPKLTLISCEE